MSEQKETGTSRGRKKAEPAKQKEVIASKKDSAPALPSGVKATFEKRPDLKAVYIERDGDQRWFFSLDKANMYFPGNFRIVENPFIK